jgi:hypothetical protein
VCSINKNIPVGEKDFIFNQKKERNSHMGNDFPTSKGQKSTHTEIEKFDKSVRISTSETQTMSIYQCV